MNISFEQTEISANIYGKEVKARKLKPLELAKYQQTLNECGEDVVKMYETSFAMLESVGVPKDLSSVMENAHLQELISCICGDKKN